MKKLFTLRNVLILVGVLFALLVFVFSFLAAFRLTANNGNWSQYQGIIWGARTVKNSDGSSHTYAADDALQALALPLVGAILVLVGGLCALVVVLLGDKLFKDEKVAKIVLLAAAGLLVLGGVFTFLTQGQFEAALAKEAGVEVQDLHDMWDLLNQKPSCGMPIVSGILAVLGGLSIAASQFLPNKK